MSAHLCLGTCTCCGRRIVGEVMETDRTMHGLAAPGNTGDTILMRVQGICVVPEITAMLGEPNEPQK